MSNIYLVRHGQAGTRHNYDALSELGRRQARLLGEHLAAEGLRFDVAISGGLRRQQETAAEVAAAMPCFPPVEVLEGWNEFDLDRVYRSLAPRLSETDAEFRAGYAEISAASADPAASIHRRWTPTDLKVIEAWLAGAEVDTESWTEFCTRVRGCEMPEGNVAIFTSATPIAVWAAAAMDVNDHRIMRIAGVLLNSSYTVVRVRDGKLRLFSLNNVPHLTDPEMRTHR